MTNTSIFNVQQSAAVHADLKNAIILSGAGSGKTTTLIGRIAHLIDHHNVAASNILAVTFTNASATELKERLIKNNINIEGLTTGTFHSVALRMLKNHWFSAAFLSKDFTILDTSDQERFLKNVMKDKKLNAKEYKISDILHLINGSKEKGLRANDVTQQNMGGVYKYAHIYRMYENACLQENMVDFSELLLRSVELLRNNPDIRKEYQDKFHHIFIDEFQDINNIQFEWFTLLKSTTNTFFLVGDDDQSIYSFRGASPLFFNKVIKQYQPNIFKLEHNYRSTQPILDASNALIAKNKVRQLKTLYSEKQSDIKPMVIQCEDDRHEAKSVVQMISLYKQQGIEYKNMAVIYRMNSQSRVIEEQLIAAKIPYIMRSGTRFFEREEIKHVLAYLHLSVNENNMFFLNRVVNVPARGIGDILLSKWEQLQIEHGENPRASANHLGPKEFKSVSSFYRVLDVLINTSSFSEKVKKAIELTGLYDYYINEKDRQENLMELYNAAVSFEEEYHGDDILNDFLEYTSLHTLDENDKDGVNLMTIHGSKGLEFEVVYGIGLDHGVLPSSRVASESALEEERRLMYVLMTRAKSHLLLLRAKNRMIFGHVEKMKISPFIMDIPKTCYLKV